MTKNEFLDKIREGLKDLSSVDVDRTVDFYKEIIEDRVEEGRTEEEAVAALGDVELIIENVKKENETDPVPTEAKKPREARGMGEGAKGALGILISIGSIIYSILFYAVIIALGMSAVALGGVAVSSLPAAILSIFSGTLAQVLLMLGVTAIGAALSVVFALCTRLAVKYGRLVSRKLTQIAEKIGK
ncbi:MAG: DUF1700 domain-containing protein [Clostridia bacterium]|nr:DUF1700 domain-containing protein [Clostridia bacterium]